MKKRSLSAFQVMFLQSGSCTSSGTIPHLWAEQETFIHLYTSHKPLKTSRKETVDIVNWPIVGRCPLQNVFEKPKRSI